MAGCSGTETDSSVISTDASGSIYSDDLETKSDGVDDVPPLSITTETPGAGTSVTVTADVSGATSITLTAEGPGCGDVADETGASPLVVTANAGDSGYCNITVKAGFAAAADETFALRFDVLTPDPVLPPLTVTGGAWISGDFPSASVNGNSRAKRAAGLPTITAVDGPGGFINGGSGQYTISYTGGEDPKAVLIKVEGYDGFFKLPVYSVGSSLNFILNWAKDAFELSGKRALASTDVDLNVALIDGLNQVSDQFDLNLSGTETGTGDVKVSISWDTATDVDLHVTDPNGKHIYFSDKTPAGTDGQLDLDSNAVCVIDNVNNENIYWGDQAAPVGQYQVRVHMWGDCEIGYANVTLTMEYSGDGSIRIESISLGAAGDEENFTFTHGGTEAKVSGTIRYEDFPVTTTGLGSSVMTPVRFAQVKVVRNSDSVILASGSTDALGKYEISFSNSGTAGYYVHVYAKADSATLKQEVLDLDGALYTYRSEDVIDETVTTDATVDLDIMKADDAGALNIFDVGAKCSAYARLNGGKVPSALKFYWESGKKPEGYASSYYKSGKGIYVLSMNSDPDEYDDIVLGHEYGHFVMDTYSKSNSPGGSHSSNRQETPTLAWGEGWATFFGLAALGVSAYMDTITGGMGVYYSVETLPAGKPLGNKGDALDGNLSEAVVAAVLLDLYDATNESKDTLSGKSTAIWTILTTYLNDSAKFSDRGVTGRDLVDFLDGWFCLGYGDKGDDDEGVQGNVSGLHELSYDFPTLTSCR